MLSRTGNPQARNLFEVIRVLQGHEGARPHAQRQAASGSNPDSD